LLHEIQNISNLLAFSLIFFGVKKVAQAIAPKFPSSLAFSSAFWAEGRKVLFPNSYL
jgi:hypothetical protein